MRFLQNWTPTGACANEKVEQTEMSWTSDEKVEEGGREEMSGKETWEVLLKGTEGWGNTAERALAEVSSCS